MYCSNCGTQIEDSCLFCPNCGTRVEHAAPVPPDPEAEPEVPVQEDPFAPAPEPDPEVPVQEEPFASAPEPEPEVPVQEEPSAPVPPVREEAPVQANEPEPAAPKKKLGKGALIGIIAGAVAVVALIVLLIVLLGGKGGGQSSWKAAVDKAIEIEKTYNLKDMIEVSMPDEVLDYVLKEEGVTRSEFNKLMKEAQKLIDEELNDPSYKYIETAEYTLIGSTPMTKEEVEELNDFYDSEFCTGKNYISEGVIASVKIKIGLYNYEVETKLPLVRIGNKWYISLTAIDLPTDMVFYGSF